MYIQTIPNSRTIYILAPNENSFVAIQKRAANAVSRAEIINERRTFQLGASSSSPILQQLSVIFRGPPPRAVSKGVFVTNDHIMHASIL